MKKNTIFSSWICKFLVFTFLVILVGSGLGRSSEVYAASKVNFDRDTLSELLSDPDIGYSLTNRIGGMTVLMSEAPAVASSLTNRIGGMTVMNMPNMGRIMCL